jgi:hypothetical protein
VAWRQPAKIEKHQISKPFSGLGCRATRSNLALKKAGFIFLVLRAPFVFFI